MKKVVIIGAGLGGLSAAIRLAAQGFSVTVLEKNENTGGKMDIVRQGGYTFDTGPSLLTMPFVVEELFASAGKDARNYLELVSLEPLCRYFFHDGTVLDASHKPDEMEHAIGTLNAKDALSYRRFLEHGRKIYNASADVFLYQPFGSPGLKGVFNNFRYLPSVLSIDALRTLDEAVRSFFIDSRVQQLFNRFATYNGSSPFRAPATLSIIPYIEFTFGGWYIKGGMYKLAEALSSLAKGLGVSIFTNTEASQIDVYHGKARGVTLATGEHVEADIVVNNTDALYAQEQLLPQNLRRHQTIEPSLAGFVLLLGVARRFGSLRHHNVFFSSNYEAEFDTMFENHAPSMDPTIYVAQTSLSDPMHAPPACSNLFVLVNAPPLRKNGSGRPEGYSYDWAAEGKNYRDLVIAKLEERGLEGISRHIEYERIITPLEFSVKYNAYRGAIYGSSSNSRLAAFLRPPNRSKAIGNLYHVGGSSHPGGGIPLVMLSGKIVAEMIGHQEGIV